MNNEGYFSTNRELWNARTNLHVDSKFYDVDSFKAGNSTLKSIEQEELGDVTGKSLLHLQCHFGLDTLSFARLGAEVTGVDFSDVAIHKAQGLASELDIPGRFICSNVLELDQRLEGQFDVVFSSYGVLGWLPDLNQWAKVVRRFLKPNGVFCLVEFHSFFSQYNEDGELTYDYFSSGKPDFETCTQTYADGKTHEPMDEYWWNHTIADVITAIISNGLELIRFKEYPYSPYHLGPGMTEVESGRWIYKTVGTKIPYVYSVMATPAK